MRRVGLGILLGVVLLLSGLVIAGRLVFGTDSPSTAAEAPPPTPSWTVEPTPTQDAVAPPARVRIPAIGVDSSIVDIGVDATGVLVPPPTTDVTGWFAAGPAPGAVGPALLAAHVDSVAGPGVFFRLVDLRPGDEVTVVRTDGTSVVFTVTGTTRVAKTAFPTDLVYSPLPVPALRLVTCGGSFDHSARSYRDNLIVDAALK
ncbi:class F sortase [Actinophytocola oryzae]|uniref:Sortase family protein n=1 Tax=Actinophytocola oryzae TaxID=502181 RepID=A0A4R7V4F9_9PSEU|nr:class F sortase [Actinophytocola oryzae]TDV44293.1 sortase family protein [Actinophytocola oryzae]